MDDPNSYKKNLYFSEPLVQADFPVAWHPLLDYYDDNKEAALGDFLKEIMTKDNGLSADSLFLKYPPGTYYEYSNVGATLAAYILEQASGL